MRKNISSGAIWEKQVGYSRAVLIGNTIEISGTTASGTDAYEQTIAIIQIAKKALDEADASLEDVVRTRIFVTDISQWELIGKAHAEYFSAIKPATTMVEISKLISPELLVEIEFTAIIS